MINRQCLIIEDSISSVAILKEYLSLLPFFQVANVCDNYAQAIAFLSNHQVDLIFLDIQLANKEGEHFTGFDVLQTFSTLPPVIITSSHAGFAIESYRIGKAVDFLVKPFDYDRFLIAINRALNLKMTTNRLLDDEYVFLKMGRKFQRFELADIDYFEAYGIYLKVFVKGMPHVVNDTISAISETLSPKRFMRVHKSYIVNINKINGFDHNNLYLLNGKVPIGISYKPQLDGLLRLFDKLES
jgi:DNA-binding LytR/AlgR family response regulator